MKVFAAIVISGIACLMAVSGIAIADPEEDIARCARIASVGDRILCLENALRSSSGEIAAEPVVETVDVAVEAADEVAADPVAVPAQAAAPPTNPPMETAVVETAAAGAIVTTDPVAQEDEIGAEQVRARNATSEEREAELESASGLRVAQYDLVPYERLVVTLENGQVWRQIKGDTQRFRVTLNKNQTVNIMESRFGGYQLRLNEMRRIIRVKRIK